MARIASCRWTPLVLIAGLLAGPAGAAGPQDTVSPQGHAVGFRKLTLPDAAQVRRLEVAVWYPTDRAGREATLVGDSRVFVGVSVLVDAPPQPGRHPLVIISHGYGGNWTNQQWLAADLAAQGYVVAAPNHPGTTSRDLAPPGAGRLSERPRDISRVIDGLNADPAIAAAITPQRAAVVGHSLGGWTAVALAGGRFDPDRLAASCRIHPAMAACGPEIASPPREGAEKVALELPPTDERVGAVVTLDLGLSQGFDPASLAAITKPVLVIAAGPGNPRMPVELESRYLADRLPAATTRYAAIGDAGHFSFLAVCKADAIPLLEADRTGGGMVCRDGGGRDRATIQRQTADLVSHFLNENLGVP